MPEGATDQALHARALFALGAMCDQPSAIPIHERALEIFRELGDVRGVAVCHNALGVSKELLGADYSAARGDFEASLDVWRRLGDVQNVARTISNLAGVVVAEGNPTRGRELYRECRAMFEGLGDQDGAAWTLIYEGDAARDEQNWDAARQLYDEALARFRALSNQWGVAGALTSLGHLAADRGQRADARRWYEQALESATGAGDRRGIVRLLEAFACLAAGDQDAARALKLAGAAAAIRHAITAPILGRERTKLERALESVRLGPHGAAAATAWMEGWSMSVGEALEYARTP
jgi:tetratricopeptide (TPR) repeat protein